MAEAVGGPEWPFHKPGEVLPLPNFSETVLEPERVGGGGGGGGVQPRPKSCGGSGQALSGDLHMRNKLKW